MTFFISLFYLLLVGFALFTLPDLVSAQTFVPLAETPSGSKLGNIYSSTGNLASFVNGLFKFAIGIAAIGAVLRIAYAGYLYMGQAEMWSSKGKAKEILGDVVLGLLLLMAVWLILRQINPAILDLDALKNLTPVQPSSSSAAPAPAAAPSGFLAPNQDPTLQGLQISPTGPGGSPQVP